MYMYILAFCSDGTHIYIYCRFYSHHKYAIFSWDNYWIRNSCTIARVGNVYNIVIVCAWHFLSWFNMLSIYRSLHLNHMVLFYLYIWFVFYFFRLYMSISYYFSQAISCFDNIIGIKFIHSSVNLYKFWIKTCCILNRFWS